MTYAAVEDKGRTGIERGINVVTQWRGLAARYDKHALTYRGAVVLAAILTWAKALYRACSTKTD